MGDYFVGPLMRLRISEYLEDGSSELPRANSIPGISSRTPVIYSVDYAFRLRIRARGLELIYSWDELVLDNGAVFLPVFSVFD